MKIFPVISALLVCVALYFIVLDRGSLLALVGATNQADAAQMQPETENETDQAFDSGTNAELEQPTDAGVRVVVLRSTESNADTAVVLRGRTEALRNVQVMSETSGQIVSDPIRAGARVEEGQVLCEIDPGTRRIALLEAEAGLITAQSRVPEAEARVAEAQAQLVAAEIDANAASRLSESGFASETRAASSAAGASSAQAAIRSAQAGVEQALSGIQSAEAAVQRAQEDLERLTITAPFSGYLETDTAELGSLMQPGALCASIIELDRVKIVGFLPETSVARVSVGASAGARLINGQEVQGVVTFVSRSADPQTRTFRVELEVPNDDLLIRDGQTADILIQTPGTPAHLVPSSALTLNDDGTLGLRIVTQGNIVRFNEVTFLRDTVEGALVSGLPAQADIIVIGQEFVTDGVQVIPTYQETDQ
mgnify:CR=1 FL=1